MQFWDPRSGQAQFVLSGHKNSGEEQERRARVWLRLNPHLRASVIAINLSPAGNLLATGSGDFK